MSWWLIVFIVVFLIGLLALIKGSDVFIDGAANIARGLGVSQHLIGLTLVAFATSLPEFATSVVAVMQAEGGLSIGNIIGSNVANICLVLGTAAFIIKIEPSPESTRDAVFMNIFTFIFILLVVIDNNLNQLDGLVLLTIFAGYVFYLYTTTKLAVDTEKTKIWKNLAMVGVGLVALVVGAYFLVWSAVGMADELNVLTTLIGLTIVAFGTSLPELVTSIQAAIKKKAEISLGNIIGSNIFNVVFVLGFVGIMSHKPLYMPRSIMIETFPLLVFVSLLALLYTRRHIGKLQACILLGLYVVFLLFILNIDVFPFTLMPPPLGP